MKMHRNFKLIILLVALIGISLILGLSSGKKRSPNFRTDKFSLADTANLQSVRIDGENEVLIERTEGRWRVNGKYNVNSNLKNVLLAVINQVAVRRPVSKIQQEEIAAKLSDATKVTLGLSGETRVFYAGGNSARTQSYFMEEGTGEPYVVEIPGYRNYISGIFNLTEQQWRDRTLFNTHWRSLQRLTVTYPDNPQSDLNISFEEEFFKVEGVQRMDTTSLMSYLSGYEFFEANEFIPRGFSSSYDSLTEVTPIAVIELREINIDNNQRLTIYPKLDNDNYVLVTNKNDEQSLIDFGRLRSLLIRPADLAAN